MKIEKKIIFCFFIVILNLSIVAQGFDLKRLDFKDSKEELELHSKSVILIDLNSHTVLYEKNPNMIIPPASLTKIVTIYTALELAKEKGISLNDEIEISENAYHYNIPRDSSKMFLAEGQIVTFLELLKGLSVSSGNDAGIAIAEKFTGSVAGFVNKMNENMKKLGLSDDMFFVDSHGYSADNKISAESYAKFCMYYLEKYSWTLEELHSLKEFAYPKQKNMKPGYNSSVILQRNTNTLLKFEGVTGLKTGYIHESGYNLALTALKQNRPILIIMLGIDPEPGKRGSDMREEDGIKLINYAYHNFTNMPLFYSEIREIKVFGGSKDKIKLNFNKDIISIPVEYSNDISVTIKYAEEILAPVSGRSPLGHISYSSNGVEFYKYNLYPKERVDEETGFFSKLILNTSFFFKRLFSKDLPPTESTVAKLIN